MNPKKKTKNRAQTKQLLYFNFFECVGIEVPFTYKTDFETLELAVTHQKQKLLSHQNYFENRLCSRRSVFIQKKVVLRDTKKVRHFWALFFGVWILFL